MEKLTDLLYNNGIAKAQQEAERLKGQAEIEAKQIVQEAEKQARELNESAKRESAELMKSTESELQLKARRVIHDTRAAIENQLLKEVVEEPLSQTLSSADFYKEIILELARSSEFSKGKVWLPCNCLRFDWGGNEYAARSCHFRKRIGFGPRRPVFRDVSRTSLRLRH